MRKSHSLQEIIQVVEPVIEAEGYHLVDVVWGSSFNRRTFTVFIDRPDGVLLDDCQALSRMVGDLLEERQLISGPYVLEVSSPGAERPLKVSQDFELFVGRYALIKIHSPLPGSGATEIYGYLRGLADDAVLCELADGSVVNIPLAQITKARLAIKF